MADPLTALGVISGLGKFLGNMLNYGQAREKQNYEKQMNERDFQYQQDLQQQIFAREDNAVQRRMSDLEAAGLNPNLAAGSAAGAGTVVGRSNTQGISTPEMQVGSMLDTISAAQQIKAQKQQTENLQIERDILDSQRTVAANNAILDIVNTATQLGMPMKFGMTEGKNGSVKWHYIYKPGTERTLQETTLFNAIKNQFQTNEQVLNYYQNQNSMMSKDLQFYTADKVFDYAARTVGLGLDLFSPFGNLKGLNKYNRR